jgi:ATP-dependent Lhr-like helicase
MVLPRPRPGRRQPFWLQRLRAKDLLQIAQKYDDFPIILETYREVLREVLDLDGLKAVLGAIASGQIAVTAVESPSPSPMAAGVMMGFVDAYMYEGETPRAERRGALLALNRELLREILGSEQLRDLLDPRAIAAVHARLQRTAEGWQPRNPDEAWDLLVRLGDLTEAELEERGVSLNWLDHRAVQVAVHGAVRWIAAENQGLYADLEGNAGAIIRRFAQNRGPFQVEDVVDRYGYAPETVTRYLAVLQAEGLLSAGEYTAGVTGREYCDSAVLQQIHRQTLSLLRREVEPVDGETFARFLLAWHGLGRYGQSDLSLRGAAVASAVRKSLAQLQGLPLPAESWERDILPARVPGYQPLALDQLCATGQLHWGALPGGKLAFYLPEAVGAFAARFSTDPVDLTPEQERVLAALRASGADFLGGIARAAGLTPPAALEALWALAWAGLVTNDTFTPVRHAVRAGKVATKKGRPMALLQGGTGRWSLTARLAPGVADPAEIYTRILLDRYGVVTREAVQAEEGPVAWSEVLAVLKRMELRGQVRQGYFVSGLSGAQFALPEAVERLRKARDEKPGAMQLVAACDPANPYGSILPMPNQARIARLPSTYLVLADGRPVLVVESFGKRLVPLAELTGAELRQALAAVKGLLAAPAQARAKRRVEVETWGDRPVLQSEAAPVLQSLGFERAPTKLLLYRSE